MHIIFALIFSTLTAAASPLEIIKLGHPTLRLQAQEVEFADIGTPAFQRFADAMLETMRRSRGVGLAAPQVDRSLRMFVMGSFPDVPVTVVINPRLEYLESFGTQSSREGCLSIPGKTFTVRRYKRVRMEYLDRQGVWRSEELSGFKAIIAQHEYDHLNGVLLVDFIESMSTQMNYVGFSDAPLM
jgi:peptide deformylase